MREVTGQNFGLLIAYVLPGFVSLWAVGQFSPVVSGWLEASAASGNVATVGGFLYVTLASVGTGLTVSTVRWAIIDTLHHCTGIHRPRWDDSKLQEKLGAFEALVENHYRYYQFYANMLVAMFVVLLARLTASGRGWSTLDLPDCGILLMSVVYWAGSRDALRKYYTLAAFLLGTTERKIAMTNGHCCETYESEEARKGTPRSRVTKTTQPARKVAPASREESSPVREREPRRS